MLELDGSHGEGGGQIIRTALALSVLTGQAFRIRNIRAKRKNPGLARQHLVAVDAARQVCAGQAAGARLASRTLEFRPGTTWRESRPSKASASGPRTFDFRIGSAGSTSLVLQTVLPALLTLGEPSRVTIEGGTHNPLAPPFEALAESFLPLVARLGPVFRSKLVRCGFFPVGGGRVEYDITPGEAWRDFELLQRGAIERIAARSLISRIPEHVATRELARVAERLHDLPPVATETVRCDSPGPGNCLLLAVVAENLTSVHTAFGSRGVRAEDVADQACQQVQSYLASDAPIDEFLADQLLLPLAVSAASGGPGGVFRTSILSGHTETHVDVLRMFLDITVTTTREEAGDWRIEVRQSNR